MGTRARAAGGRALRSVPPGRLRRISTRRWLRYVGTLWGITSGTRLLRRIARLRWITPWLLSRLAAWLRWIAPRLLRRIAAGALRRVAALRTPWARILRHGRPSSSS